MLAGMIAATASMLPDALGIPQKAPAYVIPTGDELKFGLGILAAAVFGTVAVGVAGGERSSGTQGVAMRDARAPVIQRSTSGCAPPASHIQELSADAFVCVFAAYNPNYYLLQ
jgi:hypothetical protein